jgi:hypothetical protein
VMISRLNLQCCVLLHWQTQTTRHCCQVLKWRFIMTSNMLWRQICYDIKFVMTSNMSWHQICYDVKYVMTSNLLWRQIYNDLKYVMTSNMLWHQENLTCSAAYVLPCRLHQLMQSSGDMLSLSAKVGPMYPWCSLGGCKTQPWNCASGTPVMYTLLRKMPPHLQFEFEFIV